MMTSPSSDVATTAVQTARPPLVDRHASVIALALLVFHAALTWMARAPGILTGHDDTTYIVLGHSLQAFQYRELHRIDAPVHMLYPPIYPTMLGIWSAIGGDRFNWLVLVSIMCSVATLGLTYAVLSRLWSHRIALCCLAALSVNPPIIEYAGMVASEIPYAFFQTLALWALSFSGASPTLLFVGGAAGLLGALTRSVGVTLIAAIGLYWLWHRQFRALAVYALVAALTVGAWLVWTVRAPAQDQVPGRSYVADAAVRPQGTSLTRAIVDRFMGKVPYVNELYWRLPVPSVQGTPLDNIAALPIVLVGLALGLVELYRRWPIALVYLMTYGALLMVWPWVVGRFLVPLLPVVVPTLVLGLAGIARWFAPRWETRTAALTGAALVVSGIVPVLEVVKRQQPCDPGAAIPSRACLNDKQTGFFAAVEYVAQHTKPDAVFLSGKGATLYYYTGRRVVSAAAAMAQPPEQFVGFLRQNGVTHILLMTVMPYGEGTNGPGPVLGEMVKENCEELYLEQSFPASSFLFRVPAAGEHPASTAACRAADAYLAAAKAERLRDEP